jgi:hypothetical protein
MCTVEWSSLVSDLDIGERQKKTHPNIEYFQKKVPMAAMVIWTMLDGGTELVQW